MSKDGNCSGLRIVIRNSECLVMAASAQCVAGVSSPQIVEAMAILQGLKLANDNSLLPVVLDSDAVSMGSLIVLNTTPCFQIGLVHHDILDILAGMSNCYVTFALRKTSKVSHQLAKIGLFLNSDCLWIEDCHSSIWSLGWADCPSGVLVS
ncbi:hypothetical protein ACOSQ2_004352 [Xanthoceras sorbifolium]